MLNHRTKKKILRLLEKKRDQIVRRIEKLQKALTDILNKIASLAEALKSEEK